jgi:hypothetical protein
MRLPRREIYTDKEYITTASKEEGRQQQQQEDEREREERKNRSDNDDGERRKRERWKENHSRRFDPAHTPVKRGKKRNRKLLMCNRGTMVYDFVIFFFIWRYIYIWKQEELEGRGRE